MFFFVFCGLLFLLHFYVAFRSLHDARVPQPWNALGWLASALFALSLPATLFATPRVPRETARLRSAARS